MNSSRGQCCENLPLKIFDDNSDNLNGNSDTGGKCSSYHSFPFYQQKRSQNIFRTKETYLRHILSLVLLNFLGCSEYKHYSPFLFQITKWKYRMFSRRQILHTSSWSPVRKKNKKWENANFGKTYKWGILFSWKMSQAVLCV